jgi:hypothetical protein
LERAESQEKISRASEEVSASAGEFDVGPSRGSSRLHSLEYFYKKTRSPLSGVTRRPLISIKLVSGPQFVLLDDVLIDSGADVSVVPRDVGEALWEDITQGRYVEIQGIVPGTKLISYLHPVKMVIGPWSFQTLVAVADSNNVPPVLGRSRALDRLLIALDHGQKVILSH